MAKFGGPMRTKTWAATEAKARFSHLVDSALRGEPQIVTRRGEEAVVVISARTYRAKIEGNRGSLVDFFARSPHRDVEIAPIRSRETGRDVEL
jgi:prevent-host-death family protein